MTWFRGTLLVALLGFWIASCGGGQSSTDGNTNWLRRCDDTTACGGGLECICGVCARSCSSSAACQDLGANATCAPGGAACAVASVCTLECTRRDDCTTRNASLECIDGACMPASVGPQEAGTTSTGGSTSGTGGRAGTGGVPGGTGGSAGGADAASDAGSGGASTGGSTAQPKDAATENAPSDAGASDVSVTVDAAADVTHDSSSDAVSADVVIDVCANSRPLNRSQGPYATWVPLDPPVATGGAITPGIYALTALTEYIGPGGREAGTSNSREYWTLDVKVTSPTTALVEGHVAFNFPTLGGWADWAWSITGNTIVEVETCSDGLGPLTITYTATPDEIRLYFGILERVFTRVN